MRVGDLVHIPIYHTLATVVGFADECWDEVEGDDERMCYVKVMLEVGKFYYVPPKSLQEVG